VEGAEVEWPARQRVFLQRAKTAVAHRDVPDLAAHREGHLLGNSLHQTVTADSLPGGTLDGQ